MSTMKQSRLRGWLFPIVSAGVLAVTAVGLVVTQAQAGAVAEQQQTQMTEMKQRITELSQVRVTAADEAAALAAGAPSAEVGAALDRIAADEEAIGELLKTIFTWDSTASYEKARETLMSKYGLAADSRLLTEFLPPAPVEVDGEGNEYPYIEAVGLNSSLGAFTVKPTHVVGTDYSYVVIASAQTSSTDGSTLASRGVVLEVTTGPDGVFQDVQGWASPSAARSSGSAHTGSSGSAHTG